MRIEVVVNRDVALRAGQDVHGSQIVDVPAASLTVDQREMLIKASSILNSAERHIADYRLANYPEANATVEGVVRHLDALTAQQKDQTETKIHDMLETFARDPEWFVKWSGFEEYTSDPRVAEILPRIEAVKVAIERKKAEEEQERRQAMVQREEVEARRKEAYEADEKKALAERESWIRQHGSARLRRLLQEGIKHTAIYREERLAMERPGWRYWDEIKSVKDTREPFNATEEALALLDEARQTAPDAVLRFWQQEDDGEETEPCTGYLAESTFLGEPIVYFGLGHEDIK
jgi:hypothetical protein